jgi:hypothetical protein
MKKVVMWYNLLLEKEMLDFTEEGKNQEDGQQQEAEGESEKETEVKEPEL